MPRKIPGWSRFFSILTVASIWIIFAGFAAFEGVRTYRNWQAANTILRNRVTVYGKELSRQEQEVTTAFVQSRFGGNRFYSGTIANIYYGFTTPDGRQYFGTAASNVSTSIPDSRFTLALLDRSRKLVPGYTGINDTGAVERVRKTFTVHYARSNPQLHAPISLHYLEEMGSPWLRFFLTYLSIAAGIGALYWVGFYEGELKRRLLRWLDFPVRAKNKR